MRFTALRTVLMAAIMAGGAGSGGARADETKGEQPIGTAAPRSDSVTNLFSAKPRSNGLKQLEQDLFKPFETIAPKGSLDGAFAPPAPEPSAPSPVIQSKRAKELLERRKDWVFQTPEEILSTTSSDDITNRKDNENNASKLSPIQRFYERLFNKDEKDPNRSAKRRNEPHDPLNPARAFDDSDVDDNGDMPFGMEATQREMKKLLTPKGRKEDLSGEENRSPFSDVFGLGRSTRPAEELEMQRERMDQYKQLLGLPVAPRMDYNPLKQYREMVDTSAKTPTAAPTANSLGSLPQNMFAQPGAAVGGLNKSFLPESSQIHDTPSLAPALPRIEPPKSLPPPVTFGAPRRSF